MSAQLVRGKPEVEESNAFFQLIRVAIVAFCVEILSSGVFAFYSMFRQWVPMLGCKQYPSHVSRTRCTVIVTEHNHIAVGLPLFAVVNHLLQLQGVGLK